METKDIKKMGRPKGDLKEKITLSIRPNSLEKGRKLCIHLKKSLSGLTEDLYDDMHDNFFELQLTPEEKMEKIERTMQDLKNELKNKKEGGTS